MIKYNICEENTHIYIEDDGIIVCKECGLFSSEIIVNNLEITYKIKKPRDSVGINLNSSPSRLTEKENDLILEEYRRLIGSKIIKTGKRLAVLFIAINQALGLNIKECFELTLIIYESYSGI